jgi:hypothetical protein
MAMRVTATTTNCSIDQNHSDPDPNSVRPCVFTTFIPTLHTPAGSGTVATVLYSHPQLQPVQAILISRTHPPDHPMMGFGADPAIRLAGALASR